MFGIALLFSIVIVPVPVPVPVPVIVQVHVPAQDRCPSLNVASSTPERGKASYYANLIGGDAKVSPTFNWTISVGMIAQGQGTPAITVDAAPGDNVTATLEVGGFRPTCSVMSSSTETISAEEPSKCAVLGVEGDKTDKGEIVFRATAEPIPSGNFTFSWKVSAGKITGGQGSGNVFVAAPKGTSVTATMDVGGLDAACPRTASGIFTIQ